jgi:hypothetical protein
METACPACGKTNDLGTTAVCARCSCDLSALARILTGAIWHLKAAARELRSGDWEEALKQAERSWTLRHSPPAARAACLAATALGRRQDALCWRRRAGAAEG